MEIVLATWNIYWLGSTPPKEKGARTEEDLKTIGDVIRHVSPDVLALQEIVDPEVLKDVLRHASSGGREYVIEAGGGAAYLRGGECDGPCGRMAEGLLLL